MENKCSTESCETKPQTAPDKAGDCCPVEMAISCWNEAFCQAMREVQVDILKKKIQASWGPMMEKVGGEILEAQGVQWQSMLASGKAQKDLRESIVKIWSEKK